LAPSGPASSPGPLLRTRLGDYELIRLLGQGAMGTVYEALQISLNRRVALKTIRAGLFASEAERHRFQNEAEAVAVLDHPGIVPVYGVGESEGWQYFSMKLIQGESLAWRLEAFRDDPRAGALLLIEAARAIQHAHQRGILHRDLKPANILLDENGQPHVTDFGLAKRFQDDSSLTQSGVIMGTPSYMAPEQASGHRGDVTTATDVYGLGAVLYALLTGRPPFLGETVLETIDQVRQRRPDPPSHVNPRVGRDLETICLKCLEKDPKRRYASAEALASDLRHWVNGEPIAARPVNSTARAWMWCRRNPKITGLLLALALFAAGSCWQWFRAERLLLQAQCDASRCSINKALTSCDQGDVGHGLLHLVKALRTAPPGSEDLKQAVRLNLLAWSRHTNQLKFVLDHSATVGLVAFSPDSRTILTLSLEGSALTARGISVGPEHKKTRASPDSQAAPPSGVMAGRAQLWSAETGQALGGPLGQGGGTIISAAFSPDSNRLLTGSTDGTARLWAVPTGSPQGEPFRHRGPIRCVAFRPDGKAVLTCSTDGTARLWDVLNGSSPGRTLSHKDWVWEGYFRPDGRVVLTASADSLIHLWDVQSGRLITEMAGIHAVRGSQKYDQVVTWSDDGTRIVSNGCWGSAEKFAALLWDGATGQLIAELSGHGAVVRAVTLSRSGRIAITAGEDRTARLWNAETGRPLGPPPLRHQDHVLAVALSPDGRIALTGSADRTARLWDVNTGTPLGDPLHHQDQVVAVAFHPGGQSILTGSRDGAARLWALVSPRRAPETVPREIVPEGTFNELAAQALSRDGARLLTGHGDGTAQVRDGTTSTPIGPPLRNEYPVISVAISPDGEILATGCTDGTARVWSARTRQALGQPMTHKGPVRSLALSPDGQSVLTGSDDGTARLWHALTGMPIGPPLEHGKGVSSVGFSRDGTALLTRTDDGAILRWMRPPEPSGPDECFILWTQMITGAVVESDGTIHGLSPAAWVQAQKQLESFGGAPSH
jgi:WD40 repeat protein/tRNA A-37 threonylcarbamoyl transferase component Bud32